MILWNSYTEPGQPCVITSGSALGSFERWWMKCSSRSRTCVFQCSNWFRLRSCARQSYFERQYADELASRSESSVP